MRDTTIFLHCLHIQAYLGKLFANIKQFEADVVSPVAVSITALVSNEREKVTLYK